MRERTKFRHTEIEKQVEELKKDVLHNKMHLKGKIDDWCIPRLLANTHPFMRVEHAAKLFELRAIDADLHKEIMAYK